jgi:heme A synthase
MKEQRFARYAWVVLAFTVGVILWGAYVRATGSGAGCGAHWPSCQGQIVPRAAQTETLIEYSHRLTSALSGLLVLVMLIWALRLYPKGHIVRTGAWLSLAFMITEGAVGAGLVLFELVADNQSVARAAATATHFTNTLFLVSALTLTAWWASGGQRLRWRNQGQRGWLIGVGMLGLLILGVSGAITALGDTLFPSGSLAEGIQQDFAPTAHFLVQLRVWHPVTAVAFGVYLWVMATAVAKQYSANSHQSSVHQFAKWLKGLVLVQLSAGVVNLLLLAPVWMQIVHLLLADLVLIVFVLLAAAVLAQEAERTEMSLPSFVGD